MFDVIPTVSVHRSLVSTFLCSAFLWIVLSALRVVSPVTVTSHDVEQKKLSSHLDAILEVTLRSAVWGVPLYFGAKLGCWFVTLQ
jgi:hypothetical protein